MEKRISARVCFDDMPSVANICAVDYQSKYNDVLAEAEVSLTEKELADYLRAMNCVKEYSRMIKERSQPIQ